MAKHNILWKSYGMYSLKELAEYEEQAKINLLNNEYTEEEITEEQITQEVYDDIDMDYDCEITNLDVTLNGRILVIANIGRWNGRVNGYKILGNNLNEVVSCSIGCDEKEVYCDGFNVRATGYHHDGRNHVEFREIREDRNIDVLLNKIYDNEPISRREINYYTRSLRPYVKQIYGF